MQNSIYFVNCESFQHKIFKKYGLSPLVHAESPSTIKRQKESQIDPKTDDSTMIQEKSSACSSNQASITLAEIVNPSLILDFSAVNYVDTSGVKAILQLVQDYKKLGVSVYICKFQRKSVALY